MTCHVKLIDKETQILTYIEKYVEFIKLTKMWNIKEEIESWHKIWGQKWVFLHKSIKLF